MGGWLEEGEGLEQRPGGWGRELTSPPHPPPRGPENPGSHMRVTAPQWRARWALLP